MFEKIVEKECILMNSRISDWNTIIGQYRDKYKIVGVLGGEIGGGGISEKIEQVKEKNLIIVLGKAWEEDVKVLENLGFIAFKHFIPEWCISIIKKDNYFDYSDIKKYALKDTSEMGRMFRFISKYKDIVAIYANCQSQYISQMLRTNSEFNEKYIVCQFPFIQSIAEEKDIGFSKDYMQYIKVFIYQNVSSENVFGKMLATEEHVLPLLDEGVMRIAIPFVYFSGYYPQYIRNVRNDAIKRGEGHTPYGDAQIQTLLESGRTIAEIERILSDDNLYSVEELETNVEKSFKELKKREQYCDIEISDIIEQYYKEVCLFYSPSHPTNFCLRFLVKRILQKMQIKNLSITSEGLKENDRVEMFIYPSVKKKLGLTFEKSNFTFFRDFGICQNIREYVELYSKYNFPEKSSLCLTNFRTINVNHMFKINEQLVSERRVPVFNLNGRMIHANLYLTVEQDLPQGWLMKFPEVYAPQRSILVNVIAYGKGNYPVTIKSEGEVIINIPVKKGQVILLDTMWYMK